MSVERTLPHNDEAERAVLGAILLSNDAIDAVADIVGPANFYRAAHRAIYGHALRVHERRTPVDLVTIRESLAAAGELDAVGGPAYITALVDGVPHGTNAEHYAAIVRDKATLRDLIFCATKTLQLAYAADEDSAAILERAQADIFGIATRRESGGFVPIADVLRDEVYPALEHAVDCKSVVTGVPTGLVDLDAMTSGFQESDLVIVAGRPSMGKTSLLMDIALHASMKAARDVGIFSLEMTQKQLGLRAVMSEGRIDGHRLRTGCLGDGEWGRLSAAISAVSAARLHIDQTPAIGMHDVRARCRKLKAQHGLDLVLLDYVQLMKGGKAENRTLQLAELSGGLKALAKELSIPIVVLSQLSRTLESRADKRPMLSDLRESGALEQDADVVLFVYRDEVYNEHTADRDTAELIIGKQRNGPTGTVKVGFDKAQTRFFNLKDWRR